jgi:hypothetical protein
MIQSFADKDPQEVDFFNIDFTDQIPSGDAIASIVSVFVAVGDAALLLDQFAFSGLVVSGRWRGGTLGREYTITARVITSAGRTLDKSGRVRIANT